MKNYLCFFLLYMSPTNSPIITQKWINLNNVKHKETKNYASKIQVNSQRHFLKYNGMPEISKAKYFLRVYIDLLHYLYKISKYELFWQIAFSQRKKKKMKTYLFFQSFFT